MEILCYGLNHRTAPVEVRERFAVAESVAGDLGTRLARDAGGGGFGVVHVQPRGDLRGVGVARGGAARVGGICA